MRLRNKIITGYVLIAVLTAMIALAALVALNRFHGVFARLPVEAIPAEEFLLDLKFASHEVLHLTKGVLLWQVLKDDSGPSGAFVDLAPSRVHLDEAKTRLHKCLQDYRLYVQRHSINEDELLDLVEPAANELLAASEAMLTATDQDRMSPQLPRLQERLENADAVLDYRVSTAISLEEGELQNLGKLLANSLKHSQLTIVLSLGAVFLLAATGGGLLSRSILRPVEGLTAAVRGMSAGKLGEQLVVSSHDELGELGRVFNAMSLEIASSQQALIEMRDYAESILNSMTNPLLVVRTDGSIVQANAALTGLSGYQPEQFDELSIEALFAIDWPQLIAAGGESLRCLETVLHLRDGGSLAVAFSWAVSHQTLVEEKEYICVVQDISALKRAEAELAANNRFLESVLNSMSDEIFIIEPHSYRIVGCNNAFAASYGVDPRQLGEVTCHQVTHGLAEPCFGTDIPCPMEEIRATRSPQRFEHAHPGADGETEYFDIQCCPVLDAVGEITQIVHVSRNITEQKLAERTLEAFSREMEANNRILVEQTVALEQAHAELKASQSRILQQEKMASIGQLAAGVAHEINNPMGFIISNLGTLQKYSQRLLDYLQRQEDWILAKGSDRELPEELAGAKRTLKVDYLNDDLPALIAESLSGADRVKKIVQDLKSFSRVDQMEFKAVDLNECLESTINIIWNELKYKAELVRDYGELPPVSCFPQQLNQVFMNILVNAAQAIDGQGEIRVKTWQQEQTVRVAISDTGCGIPEAVRSRIFEPFFTTKDVGSGTGLGMSIVFDIVKKHRGEILVDSEVGQGTTFTVVLPLGLEEAMLEVDEPEFSAAADPPAWQGVETSGGLG